MTKYRTLQILFCVLLIQSLTVAPSIAQGPPVIWDETVGGTWTDDVQDMSLDPNGKGVFVVGSSNSQISGDKTEPCFDSDDAWVVRLDANGEVLWTKTLGGLGIDVAEAVLATQNRVYVLASSMSSTSDTKTVPGFGSYDYWLICMDHFGSVIWQGAYGGEGVDGGFELKFLPNGHLLLCGESNSGVSGNKTTTDQGEMDIWVVEVSAVDGTIIQQKGVGTESSDDLYGCAVDESGNIYLLAGNYETGISGDKTDDSYGEWDLWVVKLDPELNIVKDNSFGGGLDDRGAEIVAEGGNVFICASSNSPISGTKTAPNRSNSPELSDCWMMRLDEELNLIWDQTYGGLGEDDGRSMVTQPFQKLAVISLSISGVGGNRTVPLLGSTDCWLVILDHDGNILTQEAYGGVVEGPMGCRTLPTTVVGNDSGELFMATTGFCDAGGQKTEDNIGLFDFWIVKVDADDYLTVEELNASNFSPSPNPFDDRVRFDFTEVAEELTIRFYNTQGQLIDTKKAAANSVFEWTVSGDSQVYLYEISGSTIHANGRILKN